MEENTKKALSEFKSLGDILKIIRIEVFGLSLFDFGEMIGFSASSYQRYESNIFGKNFEKNRLFKLKSIAENISAAVFDESILIRKSKVISINKGFIKIEYNKKLKEVLLSLYEECDLCDYSKIGFLKSYDVCTKRGLEDYVYVFFILFLGINNESIGNDDRKQIIDYDRNNDRNNEPLESELEKNRTELEKESRIKRIALGLSMLDEDTSSYDFIFKYNDILRFEYFDINSGDYFTYRYLEITNQGSEKIDHVIHREYCEEKIKFSEMNIKAYNLNDFSKDKLFIEKINQTQPCIIQTFKIKFPYFVLPGEKIKVYLSFMCPGEVKSFAENEPFSTSISLRRYKKGTDNLTLGIFSKYKMSGIYIEEISHNYEMLQLNLSYYEVTSQLIDDFQTIFEDEGMPSYGFMYKIEKPNALGFRIHFKYSKK